MCDKVILENGGALMFVSIWYKNKIMCNRAVDTCPFVFDFVPDRCSTQYVCDKFVSNTYL